MPIRQDNRASVLAFALLAALVLLCGCGESRERAVANSAATIWEAAQAIRMGAPVEAPARAIQRNAAAIIKANGATYAPAEQAVAP